MLQKQKQRNSVQDNNDLGSIDPNHLDNSYLEAAIFSLWRMDILGFIKTKAILAKQFHIQPSEVDKMPYWEYEYFMKYLEDATKKENEEQENTMKQYDVNKFKQPKYTAPKMPSMNIPKY